MGEQNVETTVEVLMWGPLDGLRVKVPKESRQIVADKLCRSAAGFSSIRDSRVTYTRGEDGRLHAPDSMLQEG
jgi:hypothetical protein